MTAGGKTIQARIDDAGDGQRLDRALAAVLPEVSRERLKALMREGAVTDRGGVPARDPTRRAARDDVFLVTLPPPRPLANAAEAISLNVVFEDAHLIVIDKPAGLVVHPAAGNPDGTLVNALLHHCGGQLSGIGGVARPGIVHRLDKDTSGLMVAAKSDAAHAGLTRQFADHTIERRYQAIVAGRPMPAHGTIDAPLGRSPRDRKTIAIVAGGKRAVTHYRTLAPLADAALVECRLETGRTHQVRVHMTSIGHPLLGDPVYGRAARAHRALLTALDFRRQALHAARLGFVHPQTSNFLSFDSEMPTDMQTLRDRLSSVNY